jgi:hypothetical protein
MRSSRWGPEWKKGASDECKIEELKGGKGRAKEVKRAGLVFYVEATEGELT